MYPGDGNDATVVIGNGDASTQVEDREKQFAIQIMEDFFTNNDAGRVVDTGLIVASVEGKLLFHYNMTNIPLNDCNRHPIAHQWGGSLVCVLP